MRKSSNRIEFYRLSNGIATPTFHRLSNGSKFREFPDTMRTVQWLEARDMTGPPGRNDGTLYVGSVINCEGRQAETKNARVRKFCLDGEEDTNTVLNHSEVTPQLFTCMITVWLAPGQVDPQKVISLVPLDGDSRPVLWNRIAQETRGHGCSFAHPVRRMFCRKRVHQLGSSAGN